MCDQTIILSRRCEESARVAAARGREVTRFGPFEALLDLDVDLIWLNYAVPVAPLSDRSAALVAMDNLKAHFHTRNRRPRFEFNAAPWPELPNLLEAVGFSFQDCQPLMVCTLIDLQHPNTPGVSVRLLDAGSPDDDFVALLHIQREAFGDIGGQIDTGRLLMMREHLRAGTSLLALGLLNGVPVSAGGIFPDDSGVAELAGVATHPNARRRGVAAALGVALSAAFFARGGQVAWLSAADAHAESVYRRIGYRLLDTRLNYIE
ncbi:MAG: GNAT family N-acetyltransferase [Oscillochloris sp.]|nr:GNAT family N-acetyltransferase [Oscillochloris sp.]